MKHYDFAFVYELKNRELDTVCLIAAELERRGYSCCIINTWDRVIYKREKVSAKVVFAHAIYRKESLEFISQYVINYDKCINLQWEQIFTENITKYDFTGMYDKSGKASDIRDVIHLSWGKYTYTMLTEQFGMGIRPVFVEKCLWITIANSLLSFGCPKKKSAVDLNFRRKSQSFFLFLPLHTWGCLNLYWIRIFIKLWDLMCMSL